MAHRSRQVKQRKTFTLSSESIALLNDLCAQRREHGQESLSAVLDELLLAIHREKMRQDKEDKVREYYNDRSEEDRTEEEEWGKFAMAEFAAVDASRAG